jgi:hypothetical protein
LKLNGGGERAQYMGIPKMGGAMAELDPESAPVLVQNIIKSNNTDKLQKIVILPKNI